MVRREGIQSPVPSLDFTYEHIAEYNLLFIQSVVMLFIYSAMSPFLPLKLIFNGHGDLYFDST